MLYFVTHLVSFWFVFRNHCFMCTSSLDYKSLHLLSSHLNFSGAQKPAPCSGLGPARPAECPEEPEEADEQEGEAQAPLPIHITPPACGDSTLQTSGVILGLALYRLSLDMIDKGKVLYKLGKLENKYIHS